MRVAIFGAGLAGLAGAIALQAQGHECRIYERSRQALDAGMGFILMPDAFSSLKALGSSRGQRALGVPLTKFIFRESSGDILDVQALPSGTCSVRRRDLICALLADDRQITFDAELRQLTLDHRGLVSAALLQSGQSVEADLYVAADGCNSRARSTLYPSWPARPARVAEVVGMVRCKEAVRWAGEDFNKFHSPEGGLALGIIPVDDEHVVWFMQFDVGRFATPGESPADRIGFAEKLVGHWSDPVPHLIAHTDHSRVYLWRPIDTDLVPEFYRGNLVLVGDAAHPMSPFTSRGVSSAVADVVTLSAELDGNRGVEQALARYSRRRRIECEPYIFKGRELTDKFLAPLSRDHAMLPLAT